MINEELEFAALHADDLLLDALGARRSAGASGDVVTGLLQAFAFEVDTRTGPLTGLLTAAAQDSYGAYDAADYVPMPQPVPAMIPAPPIDEPVELTSHRRSGRAKTLVAHRAAAVVTVGSLVLGIGGVSAAVSGQGGPIDGIRRVVGSVTEQVTPQQSAQERISRMLDDATKALAVNDLRSARELLEKARTDIEGATDPTAFSALRANLIELRDRWHQAFDGESEPTAVAPSKPGTGSKNGVDRNPAEEVLAPEGKPGELVGGGEAVTPNEGPLSPESDIKATKDQIADRAEQKLEPLPDLPIDEIREPTWAPIIGDGGLFPGK